MNGPKTNQANKIEFNDLNLQQNRIRSEIEQNICNVLDHGKYILGPEVNKFEKKLSDYTNIKHVIGVSSGTESLLMALMAYDVGPGDAIFTTPFTFISTAEVISVLGATPVFVDIDQDTFNIEPSLLEKAICAIENNDSSIYPMPKKQGRLSPRGIIAVDLFGLPADYDGINHIAKEHGLFVIEDAAQSLGAEYKGKKAGTLADVGSTSFFPSKPLGGYGDGGAIFTNNDKLAEKMKSLRVHGKGENKYDNIYVGLNARLDTLQAAILLAKLSIFEEEIELRQEVAMRYNQLFSEVSGKTEVKIPFMPKESKSSWAQYSLLAKKSSERDRIQKNLQASGVPTAIYYPKPLHMQEAFNYLGYKKRDMPVSEDCSEKIFSIPMHPYLDKKTQELIVNTIRN